MPKNALATISPRRDCVPIEQLARQWAVTFAELFYVSLKERGPRFVELWVSALTDLPPEILDAACERAMQVCKFFPTPAEIRALTDKAESNALELKAEEEWHRALRVAESDRGFENLDAQTQHAIRAAGGLGWIESCPRNELQWAKKKFIEDYILIHQTRQVEHLLSDSEAKKILHRLTQQPKQLTRGE